MCYEGLFEIMVLSVWLWLDEVMCGGWSINMQTRSQFFEILGFGR